MCDVPLLVRVLYSFQDTAIGLPMQSLKKHFIPPSVLNVSTEVELIAILPMDLM